MKELAKTVLVASLAAAEYEKVAKSGKQEIEQQFIESGTDRSTVKDSAGMKLGIVTYAQGRTSAYIADEKAFLAWVEENHPSEMVRVINPDFKTRLLSACTTAGEPVDPSSGEVVPGVEMTQGRPYVSVRGSSEGKALMSELMAQHGLPEIGGGS
ncbi:hypothetical protein AB0I28_12320 [Phytomonospora sp. NPDC050363]|uniref:hypothetical protein n=1 Tax=Phytomonospora sp. NPDC050363 TaxID=3155642 RepID=UPI0033DCB2B9